MAALVDLVLAHLVLPLVLAQVDLVLAHLVLALVLVGLLFHSSPNPLVDTRVTTLQQLSAQCSHPSQKIPYLRILHLSMRDNRRLNNCLRKHVLRRPVPVPGLQQLACTHSDCQGRKHPVVALEMVVAY
jgi:hypothetical protein